MKTYKSHFLKAFGLLALTILLAAGCAETPEEPDVNLKPDTFISSYSIDMAPDSATFYIVTVYWRASDRDGQTVEYRYWVDSGDTTNTFDTDAQVRLDFPDTLTSYTFYVQAKDNSNEWDETPAFTLISMTDVRDVEAFKPNTEGVSIPPDGAATSRGVPFTISGVDVDGVVVNFQWAVDSTTVWTTVPPDIIDVTSSVVEITLTPNDLALGAHTVFFRAVDNMGNVDPSPLTVSIDCQAGFAPELSLSVADGHSFVVPFTAPVMDTLVISWTTVVDFYYGQIQDFYISTSTGQTDTTTETSFTMTDLGSGSYWIKVTANDVGGNSTVDSTNFSVVELAAGDGILCVNGVDWATYGGEIVDLWAAGVPWGNRTSYKCWDLFTGAPASSVPDFADSLLGTGSVPTWMLDTTFFDAVVWVWNRFSGDDAYWYDDNLQAAISAYLAMGGNVWIGGRHGHYIFDGPDSDDFANYCQFTGYTDGLSPDSAVAVHDSVSNMTGANMSFTNVIITSHPDAIQLFETDGGDAGLGWVILPNGAGGGGAVCYIGGREYRWDNNDLKANMDVVLRYFFGISN